MIDTSAMAARIATACPSSLVEIDAPLGPRTTYRVGGSAAVLVVVHDLADLVAMAAITATDGTATLVVGRGSNLLVADQGFPGVALALGEGFDFEEIVDETVVAGAARALPVLARSTVAAGLTGFEWAVGVPGSIGGAVRMNAGGHGADMAAALVAVTVVDLRSGDVEERPAEALDLRYRHSALEAHEVVADVRLRLAFGDRAESERALSEIVRWRREHQPGGQNAGSVFTNPSGDSAGRLIDIAGCKGLRIGTASVSTKHANFIQADPGGSADDVLAVMQEVRARVTERTGVVLVPETHLVGFEGEQ
jgi:UDP-N-acetylmuramate dehydrogenase